MANIVYEEDLTGAHVGSNMEWGCSGFFQVKEDREDGWSGVHFSAATNWSVKAWDTVDYDVARHWRHP